MNAYSWAVNERLRYGLDDRLWKIWAHRDGHEDCTGWTFNHDEAQLICSCGEVLPVPDGSDR